MHPQDRLFCEIAIQLQLLTRQQATSCMQAQDREGVGQSVATVAMALGFMDQAAVDAVVHQQQRVLERRREAREASRLQREVESRAAAGIGHGGGFDAAAPAIAAGPTDRPPAPRNPMVSGAAPRRDSVESVPEGVARSAEAGPRYSASSGDARHIPRHSGFNEIRDDAALGGGHFSDACDEAIIEGFDALDEAYAPAGLGAGSSSSSEARPTAAPSGAHIDAVNYEARHSSGAELYNAPTGRSSAAPADAMYAEADDAWSHADSFASSDAVSGGRSADPAAAPEGSGPAVASEKPGRTKPGRSTGAPAPAPTKSAWPGSSGKGSAASAGRRYPAGSTSARPAEAGASAQEAAAAGGARRSSAGPSSNRPADGVAATSDEEGSAAAARRSYGAFVEVRASGAKDARSDEDDAHDPRDASDERPPLRRSLQSMHDAVEGRQTMPLERGSASAPHASASKLTSSKPPAPRTGSSLPPSAAEAALAQSARGTLLESSGMEQQRRELTAPQRHATGRPIPSGRDWRNPSKPPPAAEGFEIEMPLRAHPTLAPKAPSSRPPTAERRSSRPPLSIGAPALDAPKHIDRALDLCAQHGASDYQLHTGASPRMRIDGTLVRLHGDGPATALAVENALAEVLGDEERMQLTLDGELRMIYQTDSGIRARLSAFVSEQGSHVQLHLLPMDVPSAEQLGLAPALRILREKPWGLAICSGPAGSGVTTTLWALAQGLAAERARYSVSLESPLELNVQCGVGLFEQREVGRHVESYAAGVAWALAEGADLIVVSDLLAPGAFEASLHAARARCLVIAGMRAGGSFAALRRLLSEAQGDPELLRRSLADGMRLSMHQRLLPRRSGPGAVAAFELMLGSGRLMQHLRRAEMLQLAAAFEVSHDPELFTLRDALNDLVRGSVISTDAMRSALGVDRGCLEG